MFKVCHDRQGVEVVGQVLHSSQQLCVAVGLLRLVGLKLFKLHYIQHAGIQ